MTLIDVPYHPGDPQPTPAPVSPTSSTSTSAPLPTSTGLKWASLPASAEVVACSRRSFSALESDVIVELIHFFQVPLNV